MKKTLRSLVRLAGALAVLTALLPRAAQGDDFETRIPFLTLRAFTGSEVPDRAFGGARGELGAGWCSVRERDMRLVPNLEDSVPANFQEELLYLDRLEIHRPSALLAELPSSAGGLPTLLYVHGYNIDFDKGCRRAALLKRNAALGDRLLWFSWPSDGLVANYSVDEADLYWSVPELARVILDLESRFPGQRVDLAAHSLGARGLVLALYELANRRPETRVGKVVLIAADMDFDIFSRAYPLVRSVAESVTIYVSGNDRLLALSEQVHGYRRLGQAGNDFARLEGAEVIDLSGLPDGDLTGHLYHLHSAWMGEDLARLLNEGQSADARDGLLRAGQNVWKLDGSGD